MSALPYCISDYQTLRDQHCLFADKSVQLHYLLHNCGRNVFFSRPQGFGMSVLFSLIETIFTSGGEDACLQDLRQKFKLPPCCAVRLDLAKLSCDTPEILERSLCLQLKKRAESAELCLSDEASGLKNLVQAVFLAAGDRPLVFLIQNYDAPLLAHTATPDLFEQCGQVIKSFFAELMRFNHLLHFCLVSGTARFKINDEPLLPAEFKDATYQRFLADLVGFTAKEVHELCTEHFARAIAKTAKRSIYSISDEETQALISQFIRMLSGYRFAVGEPGKAASGESFSEAEPLIAPLDLISFLHSPEQGLIPQVMQQRKVGVYCRRALIDKLRGETFYSEIPSTLPSFNEIDPAILAWRFGLYAPAGVQDGLLVLKPANLAIAGRM